MIDTNQVNQAVAVAADVKTQVQTNWAAIAFAAALAARELRNFNTWCVGLAEWIVKHGGIGMLVRKLVWNPGEVRPQMNADERR